MKRRTADCAAADYDNIEFLHRPLDKLSIALSRANEDKNRGKVEFHHP